MKKIFVFLFLFVFIKSADAQKQFVNDANAEMRAVTGSFEKIKVSGGIDLYLSQSEKEEVAISASDEKLKSGIKTVVENNTLRIYYEGDWMRRGRDRHMIVYVSFRVLNKIEASGASDILVVGSIDVPALEMNLSGASDFKGAVSVSALTLNLSGASDVNIRGKATNLTVESSGASDVKGYDLSTEICTAKASGASDIQITVNNELNAHASGASSIYYQGTGVLKEMQANGSSSISKRG